jgi:hypothetical protein
MGRGSWLPAALALGLIAACDRGEPAAGADNPAAMEAARDACISAELLERARDGVEALEAFQREDAPPMGPAAAALQFAGILEQHAQLRHAASAYADSAINHARAAADSVRYMQRAEAFLPRPPEPGSVEHNVASAWLRDYAAIRMDEDHRCNWDI